MKWIQNWSKQNSSTHFKTVFFFRRGHQVLRLSLPPKREYVLLIRMTSYQRMLYRLFMEELISHRSVSNPLRAFAICCKIWNHPDVLYNFVRESAFFAFFTCNAALQEFFISYSANKKRHITPRKHKWRVLGTLAASMVNVCEC